MVRISVWPALGNRLNGIKGSPIDTTALHDIVTSAGTLSVRSPAYDAYVVSRKVNDSFGRH